MGTGRETSASGRGFTLIECLVVIGIIGTLIVLLLPAVQAAREAAHRAQCLNNLRRLIHATHSFVVVEGGFPPAAFLGRPGDPADGTNPTYSAQSCLLPYLEQNAIHDSIDFNISSSDIRWFGLYHGTVAANRIGVFAARSYHPGGVNAAMADGSARWFISGTQMRAWRGLGTRSGGEVVAE